VHIDPRAPLIQHLHLGTFLLTQTQ